MTGRKKRKFNDYLTRSATARDSHKFISHQLRHTNNESLAADLRKYELQYRMDETYYYNKAYQVAYGKGNSGYVVKTIFNLFMVIFPLILFGIILNSNKEFHFDFFSFIEMLSRVKLSNTMDSLSKVSETFVNMTRFSVADAWNAGSVWYEKLFNAITQLGSSIGYFFQLVWNLISVVCLFIGDILSNIFIIISSLFSFFNI